MLTAKPFSLRRPCFHPPSRAERYSTGIFINQETMRRKGFSPYGPSKAALESMCTIWSQELEGTGITLNMLLPGGATHTGMIPAKFPKGRLRELLKPEVIVPAAIYLASDEAAHVNGQRIVAIEWNKEQGNGL